jgi:hypothetical protein
VQIEHLPVGPAGGRPQLALDVLGNESLDQLGHGRCRAFGLLVAEQIAAFLDQPLEPLGLGAGVGGLIPSLHQSELMM